MLLNTKGTEITYPDSFTELKILVTRQYNGAKPTFDEFSTSKEEIEKLAPYRLENGASTGGGSFSQIVIIFTETGVAIENIHVNGSALESNYAIYVFYR